MLNPIKALLQILTFKLAFGKTLKCKVQLLFAHIYTTNSVIRCKVYSLLPPPTCKIQHHSMAYHIIQNRSVTYPPPLPPTTYRIILELPLIMVGWTWITWVPIDLTFWLAS